MHLKNQKHRVEQSTTQPGFILVMTLMLLSLATVIITRVYYQAAGLSAYLHTSAERQQVRILALSGLELAKSQLDNPTFEVDKYLEKIFPVLDVWQQVDLAPESTDVSGQIKLYISCELGKLNPNQLYDFKKRVFKPQIKPALQKLCAKNGKLAGLADQLEQALQKRTAPLNDLSELLADPALQQLFKDQLYRLPANSSTVETGSSVSERVINTDAGTSQADAPDKYYLTDLFTLYNPQPQLWPALLAQDYLNLLQLNTAKTIAARRQGLQQLLYAVTKAKKVLTQTEALSMLYSAPSLAQLAPEIAQLFAVNFTPPVIFSVLVQATSGLNTARIFAILAADSIEDAHMSYQLVRLYWI
ncbi:MAG TPA: hypothetical protein VJJ83_04365 [Candidatus Babeliales bacterium]|nr:hypothetical protein [Candidatus Babeliales bacterium]